jgi:hypothetical protein
MTSESGESSSTSGESPRLVKFEIMRLRGCWPDCACRYALQGVLDSAAVMASRDSRSSPAAINAVLTLQASWRARVMTLRSLDLERLQGKVWYFAANCPPVSVYNKQDTRPCHLRHLCPFCWARHRVVDLCDRLRYVYYGDQPAPRAVYGVRPRQPAAALDLVEVRTEFCYPPDKCNVHDMLAAIDAGAGRDSLIRRWKYLGGYQLYVIEPPNRRDERPVWRWSRRLLAVAETGTQDPPEEVDVPVGAVAAFRHVRRHTHITKRVLAGAVGRTCRYPAQLLYGSPQDTLELQRELHHFKRNPRSRFTARCFKVASNYGVLRNQSQRLMAAKLASLRGE